MYATNFSIIGVTNLFSTPADGHKLEKLGICPTPRIFFKKFKVYIKNKRTGIKNTIKIFLSWRQIFYQMRQ